jgi:hypothetical protein
MLRGWLSQQLRVAIIAMYMLALARAFTGAPRALALKSCTLSCKRSYSRAQSLAMAAATTTEPQIASSVPATGAATDANSVKSAFLKTLISRCVLNA